MNTIDNSQDIMDSRDIIARIEELETDHESLVEAVDEAQEAYDDYLVELEDADELKEPDDTEEGRELADQLAFDRKALSDWLAGDEAKELETLKDFANGLEGYGDWNYGETIIAESYFTEYAEEMAKDTGAIDPNAKWPLNHIDWDAAANELMQDYTESDFDGVTYYMRA